MDFKNINPLEGDFQMGKKTKKTKKKTNDILTEKNTFQKDDAIDPYDKNRKLAEYLNGIWANLNIVCINRIEIGKKGWQAYYRT